VVKWSVVGVLAALLVLALSLAIIIRTRNAK
jgi:hypothetical protein